MGERSASVDAIPPSFPERTFPNASTSWELLIRIPPAPPPPVALHGPAEPNELPVTVLLLTMPGPPSSTKMPAPQLLVAVLPSNRKPLLAKGDRLVEEGRVRRVLLHIYEVEGDTDTYTVSVSYAEEAIGRCDCKAGKQGRLCSHLFAAAVYELAHPLVEPRHLKAVDPFQGIN